MIGESWELYDFPPGVVDNSSEWISAQVANGPLAGRTLEAASRTGAKRIAVVGGVAANSELRSALPDAIAPPLELCTDNAAMIASAARYADAVPYPRYLALDAYAQAV